MVFRRSSRGIELINNILRFSPGLWSLRNKGRIGEPPSPIRADQQLTKSTHRTPTVRLGNNFVIY